MVAKRKGVATAASAKKAKVAKPTVEEVIAEETPAKKRAIVLDDVEENQAVKKQKVDEPKKEEVKEEPGASSPPSKEALARINEQARVAISTLGKYVSDKGDKSLFPEADHGLSVMVVYKKPAMVNGPSLKKNIVLPHPSIAANSAMFCLIVPDLDLSDKGKKDPDVEKQAREWEERIQADHGLTKANIAKILTQNQLHRVYRTFNDKRQLATAYDVFLVEKRVHKSVQKHLGKEFVKAHKMPVVFDYSRPLGETLKKAAATTVFDLAANKTRISVAAGHLSQPHSDLVANVEHVIASMLSSCPGGIRNVRSLYVQLSSSQPSLPVYSDEGSANEVTLPRPATVRPEDKMIQGELSTLPEGLQVEVSKSGRIRVTREKDGAGVLYPTVKDEHTSMDQLKPKLDPAKIEKKRMTKKLRNAKHKAAVEKALAKAHDKSVFRIKTGALRPLLEKAVTEGKKKVSAAAKKRRSDKRKLKRISAANQRAMPI